MTQSKKFFILILSITTLFSQDEKEGLEDSLYFQFNPDSLYLEVGDSTVVTIRLLNEDGELSNNPFYVYGGERGTISTYPRISDSTGVATVSYTHLTLPTNREV